MPLFPRAKIATWFIDTFVPAVFPRLNPAARWLLKSRLHWTISWYVLLLRFEGRRTGRLYEVPLSYHRWGDGTGVEAFTSSKGVWWRNLLKVQSPSVRFKGTERHAYVDVIESDAEAMTKALGSRDLCRKILVPVSLDQTVLLRVHFLPPADLGSKGQGGKDDYCAGA